MAVITPTYNVLLDSLVVATWSNMTTGDTAAAHFVRGQPDLVSVQAEGTFAGGTVVRLQGSITNSATSYANAITRTLANASFTANATAGIVDAYPYWKPTIASGSADNVTVNLSYWIR